MIISPPLHAQLCGLDAPNLVSRLAEIHESVTAFAFKSYVPGPSLAERLGITPERALFCMGVDQLLSIRPKAADLVRELRGRNVVDQSDDLTWIDARAIRSRTYRPQSAVKARYQALAMCSCCTQADTIVHVPMMDFRVQAPKGSSTTDRTLELIAEALIAINAPNGVILKSGNSYHYYGFELLNQGNWYEFTARCLLLEPLVDVRYIAHRLLSGRAALRITESSQKPHIPTVVACISENYWTLCKRDKKP